MSGFDDRWRGLAAAARRAPAPPVASPPQRRWLAVRRGPAIDAPWSWRLRAMAAAWVLAGVFMMPSFGRALTAPAELAPTLPVLPHVPPLPAVELPSPPPLPDVGVIVRTFEEAVP